MCRVKLACPHVAALLALLALMSSPQQTQAYDWEWRVGRATSYGGPGDPWTIHYGSCGYYYLDPTVNKGWDIAALPDAVHDFKGSCGRCYEIKCNPAHITDGYGSGLDRTSVCYDPNKSVTVMITDSCPCNYPPNYYSNKRWCCGDYYHFDMSTWTFEKLADHKFGVIGIQYREVPCDHCPENPAEPPNNPSQAVQDPPSGWKPENDKRPYGKMCFKSSLDRNQGRNSASNNGGDSGNGNGGSSSGGGNSESQAWVFGGSLLSGWKDDLSYKLQSRWSGQGPDSKAYCGKLSGDGAIVMQGNPGGLNGKRQLSMDVQVDSNGNMPDVTLNIASSSKGNCRSINLRGLSGQRKNDYMRITIPLININWSEGNWWRSDATDFWGCSSSIGAWDVNKFEFKNNWGSEQQFCVSNIQAFW